MLQQLKPEINFCSCGCEARLVKQGAETGGKGRPNYWVSCLDEGCGRLGKSSHYPWQAILEWNAGHESEFPDDFPVPFLSISGLNGDETRQLLAKRRSDFEAQIQKLKSGTSGPSVQEKLKTLRLQLDWLRYGQSWLECRLADLRGGMKAASLAE